MHPPCCRPGILPATQTTLQQQTRPISTAPPPPPLPPLSHASYLTSAPAPACQASPLQFPRCSAARRACTRSRPCPPTVASPPLPHLYAAVVPPRLSAPPAPIFAQCPLHLTCRPFELGKRLAAAGRPRGRRPPHLGLWFSSFLMMMLFDPIVALPHLIVRPIHRAGRPPSSASDPGGACPPSCPPSSSSNLKSLRSAPTPNPPHLHCPALHLHSFMPALRCRNHLWGRPPWAAPQLSLYIDISSFRG